MSLKSAAVFEKMGQTLATNPTVLQKVKAVYHFTITKDGKDHVYTVDAKTAGNGVKSGSVGSADCTIKMTDDDFFDLATGKLDAMSAFGQGKIKIGGNMMLAQKLSTLTEASKL